MRQWRSELPALTSAHPTAGLPSFACSGACSVPWVCAMCESCPVWEQGTPPQLSTFQCEKVAWMDGWMDGWIDGRKDGWMMDARMDGWKDGWMGGWMERWIEGSILKIWETYTFLNYISQNGVIQDKHHFTYLVFFSFPWPWITFIINKYNTNFSILKKN